MSLQFYTIFLWKQYLDSSLMKQDFKNRLQYKLLQANILLVNQSQPEPCGIQNCMYIVFSCSILLLSICSCKFQNKTFLILKYHPQLIVLLLSLIKSYSFQLLSCQMFCSNYEAFQNLQYYLCTLYSQELNTSK